MGNRTHDLGLKSSVRSLTLPPAASWNRHAPLAAARIRCRPDCRRPPVGHRTFTAQREGSGTDAREGVGVATSPLSR